MTNKENLTSTDPSNLINKKTNNSLIPLDFSITLSTDRAAYIEKSLGEFSHTRVKPFTEKELETFANYILYGKDQDGTSIVDKKEIQIKTKYSSYAKKEAESLDELISTPGFNESNFKSGRTRYKKEKPRINREKESDIPGIGALWADIDKIDHIIKVSTGKEEDENVRIRTDSELYHLKHLLISLRREQFYLKDIFKPTVCAYGVTAKKQVDIDYEPINWDTFTFYPLGLITPQADNSRFYNPKYMDQKVTKFDIAYENGGEVPKNSISFLNPEHIYILLESYDDLKTQADIDHDSVAALILNTLNFYIKEANLSAAKELILELKKLHIQNEVIRKELNSRFNLTHTPNYISTIYKKNICVEVSEAAQLHYEYFLNRGKEYMWKVCNQCGELKLKDTREFMRKSRSSDGLSSKCKCCEKENRQKK